ncbi:DUF4974 domain-containing protein [Flavobacteriaceae bacterium F08102]|nr:DUF4974 domain-containing protein [Flavobacteriaceae bacterium F08102]
MNEKIENILVKYLMNAADIEELEVLTNWLKKEKNAQVFKNYIRINYAMDINTNEFDTKKAKKAYLDKIKQDKKRVHRLKIYTYLKYVAAAVIVFGLGYFYKQGVFSELDFTKSIHVNNQIVAGTDKAILTLENGEEVILTKGVSFKTQQAMSNGEEIIYKAGERDTSEIAFNYLTIPRGGQFFVELADGTKVWLNSESQLKYPVSFINGKSRIVELVYGEAYFEVSPSIMHDGAKFKVNNAAQEITVLGTKFNLKAYKEEPNIYTTLVEGKVEINTPSRKQVLKPNQQSEVQIKNSQLNVREVDVVGEIAWIHGDFVFKHKTLKDIIAVLARWYNVDFDIQNKSLENVKFNGEFGKSQNLEEILNLIKNTNYINQFEINEKKILLK